MSNIVGYRIAERRKELGLTQEELAKKMGYKTRSAINKIELGVNDISQSKLGEFAEVLRTTPAYLMGWTDSQTSVEELDRMDTVNAIQEAFDIQPGLKVLFSLTKDATAEDIERAINMVKILFNK